MKSFHVLLGAVGLFAALSLPAQSRQADSVLITYDHAKQQLFKENLLLLASHYDVSIAEADLMQARLWPNPYLVWNQDLYSLELNQYMNETNQRLIQVNQTFSIAGKHTNTVKLAKINVELNKLMMQDVMRSLVYELGNRYLALSALQEKEALYASTLAKYEELIESAENKLRVGAMPLNEVTRLKSELIAVRTEAIHNKNEILAEMNELKKLLNISDGAYIRTAPREYDSIAILDPNGLELEALDNRADYLLSRKQIEYEERNLRLQKSLAIPDVMLGYQPNDKGSNYVRPYTGLVLEMYVPIFDRNQGNIKKAKAQIEQSKTKNTYNETQVKNEVRQSYAQLLNSKEGFDEFSDAFLATIEDLNRNSTINYGKKNINLLEYIDLQRIYIQNQLQYIELKYEYMRAINLLNFSVGKDIIK